VGGIYYSNEPSVSVTECPPAVVCPPSGRRGGGVCYYLWECSEWSQCQPDGTKTRTCANIGTCKGIYGEPSKISRCEYKVKKPIPEKPEKKPFNWWPLIAAMIGSAVLTGLIIWILSRKLIMVVSSRDLFRGPIAGQMLKDKLKKAHLLHKYKVKSAGIFALNKKAPSEKLINFAKSHGLDINMFKTKPLTDNMLKKAVMVISMDKEQNSLINRYVPDLYEKELEKKITSLDTKEPKASMKGLRKYYKTLKKQLENQESLRWIKEMEEKRNAKKRQKRKKH